MAEPKSVTIAKKVIGYAKEQKQHVSVAFGRAQGSKRFEKLINDYAKAHKMSVNKAWQSVKCQLLKLA